MQAKSLEEKLFCPAPLEEGLIFAGCFHKI